MNEPRVSAANEAAQSGELRDTVAVIMSVHAAVDAKHLDQSLASMRVQTHGRQRIFIYLDGPLHAEHEAVLEKRLLLGPARDVIVRGESLAGLPTGLNRLIDLALKDRSVAYLARMDADDLSMPERLQRQVDFLNENSHIGVAGTWVVEFEMPGIASFKKQLPIDPESVARFMIYRSPLAHPSVMFRREVLERGHRYDTRLVIMQDFDLWARLLAAGEKIGNVPEYLLWFRMAPGFFSRRSGWHRAWGEVRMRWAYASREHLLRPVHLLGFASLLTIRMLPSPLKRLAYQLLR